MIGYSGLAQMLSTLYVLACSLLPPSSEAIHKVKQMHCSVKVTSVERDQTRSKPLCLSYLLLPGTGSFCSQPAAALAGPQRDRLQSYSQKRFPGLWELFPQVLCGKSAEEKETFPVLIHPVWAWQRSWKHQTSTQSWACLVVHRHSSASKALLHCPSLGFSFTGRDQLCTFSSGSRVCYEPFCCPALCLLFSPWLLQSVDLTWKLPWKAQSQEVTFDFCLNWEPFLSDSSASPSKKRNATGS